MKASLKDYIQKVKWQTAKDKSHQYTVVTWKPELENEFREFVRTIYEKGVKQKFYGTNYVYLTVGKHTYWAMNSRIEATILINRKLAENINKQ